MERLTRKLKKGGYSANRHSEAQLTERLDQLKGVHKQWLQDVSDMMTGMKQSEAAGQAGALTLMMLQAGYAAIVRIGRRFESACPVESSGDNTATALGKLEDLYEQCVSELEDVEEGLEECRENGFTDELAYDELMVTKLGISQLIKQFDIATGYAEPSPEPYQYQPKRTHRPNEPLSYFKERKRRSNMKRTFTAIICTLLLVAVLAGCGSTNPFDAAAKTFSNEGMTITLTSDFSKQSMDGYTVCYAAKTAAVFALHETNDQFAAAGLNDVTLEQYAALVMQNNSSRNPVAGDDINGCPTILYDFYNEDKDVEYRYLAVMYQADDGFWLVQFASAKDDFDTYEPSFVEAAKSVSFGA